MSTPSAYLQTWRLKLSHTKTVTVAFYLNNREAKCELKVYNNDRRLPLCTILTYLEAKLDRLLTFRHHLVAMGKTIFASLSVEAICRLGIECQNTTHNCPICILVCSTSEYCAPVWCPSAHTCLVDSVLNDALRIVTRCLRPTPTDHLPLLSGIHPVDLRRLGGTFSLAYCESLNPDYILYDFLSGSSDFCQERLRSHLCQLRGIVWKTLPD